MGANWFHYAILVWDVLNIKIESAFNKFVRAAASLTGEIQYDNSS